MRLKTLMQLFVVLALCVAGVCAGQARANVDYGPKVNDAVAAQADAGATELSLLVFGPDLATANTNLGITPRRQLGPIGAESVTIATSDLQRLAAEPGVDRILPDSAMAATGEIIDTSLLTTLYPLVDGAQVAWKAGFQGKNHVAVIDSGVTPVLDDKGRVSQIKLSGQVATNGALNDPLGHGSFVAGIIAGKSSDGKYIGIAPRSKIAALNVSRADGVRSSDVMAGLLWVLANYNKLGIKVVNLSLSETTPTSYKSSALDAVCEMLWRKGVVVVVSSGNGGPDTAKYAPSNDPFVISVGATDPHGTVSTADDTLASFSTYGVTSDGFSRPDLVAPGRGIVAPLPKGTQFDNDAPASAKVADGYVRMSGTSFSAPQVSGAAELILQKFAKQALTPDQVKWLLMHTTKPVTGSLVGTLDIAAALSYTGTIGKANQGLEPSVFGAGDPGAAPAPFTAKAPNAPVLPLPTAPTTVVPVVRPSAISYPSCSTAQCVTAKNLEGIARTGDDFVAAAAAWEQAGIYDKAATDAEKAADAYTKALDPASAKSASARAAGDWETAKAYDKAAADWTVAGELARACAAWQAFTDFGRAAGVYESRGMYADGARSWETAAAAYEKAADWAGASDALRSAGDDWAAVGDRTAATTDWTRSAGDLFKKALGTNTTQDKVAGAWESVSNSFKSAGKYHVSAAAQQLAAVAWERSMAWNNAASDWNAASSIWDTSGDFFKAGEALEMVSAAWSKGSVWDRAAAAWQVSAAWNSMAWNRSMAWNADTAWDRSMAWNKSMAWNHLSGDHENAALSFQSIAKGYDSSSTWSKGALAWESVAREWNQASATGWEAAAWESAARDWTSKKSYELSGNDFCYAAVAWEAVGNFEQAAYDLAMATSQMPGTDWSVASAGAWGKAAVAWYQGMAWVG